MLDEDAVDELGGPVLRPAASVGEARSGPGWRLSKRVPNGLERGRSAGQEPAPALDSWQGTGERKDHSLVTDLLHSSHHT